MVNKSRLESCVDYLYNKGFSNKLLFEATNAVRKVAGEIECMKNGEYWRSRFSDRLDKCLNESLMVMCCDPECDTRNIKYLKTLIEDYREMHDMPEIEIAVPENQVVAPSLQNELDDEIANKGAEDDLVNEVPTQGEFDVEDEILNTTHVGEYVSFAALAEEMAENKQDEIRILDAMKELVRQGYLEVTQREPYNGTIQMCLRVR